MAFTVLLLIHRSSGLSTAEFKYHYENVHVPLIQSLAGSLFPISHTRRYTQHADEDNGAKGGGIDCVTEMQFDTVSDFRRLSDFLGSADVAIKVQKDCEAFMDPSKTEVVIIGDTVKTMG